MLKIAKTTPYKGKNKAKPSVHNSYRTIYKTLHFQDWILNNIHINEKSTEIKQISFLDNVSSLIFPFFLSITTMQLKTKGHFSHASSAEVPPRK